jgi:hypothetical protein
MRHIRNLRFIVAAAAAARVSAVHYRKNASCGGCFNEVKRITVIHSTRTVLPFLLVLLTSACSQETSPLEPIAAQLSSTANRCVVDVRDRGVKYENSENCRSLGRIAQQYVNAGGFKDNAPSRADRVAESARAKAWMALAISKTGDPRLTIW